MCIKPVMAPVSAKSILAMMPQSAAPHQVSSVFSISPCFLAFTSTCSAVTFNLTHQFPVSSLTQPVFKPASSTCFLPDCCVPLQAADFCCCLLLYLFLPASWCHHCVLGKSHWIVPVCLDLDPLPCFHVLLWQYCVIQCLYQLHTTHSWSVRHMQKSAFSNMW